MDVVAQGLAEESVASHGLRGGGAKDMETSCGKNSLQGFCNWLSDAYNNIAIFSSARMTRLRQENGGGG